MYGKRKMMAGGYSRKAKKHGGPAGHDGNKHARREYAYGGKVKMDGSQPKYDGMPKCMPN
jgi:hypothetical protein|tara:strand:- start:298 stop:477 length:180 start_codon:yes stop_codon:yes gene_type:complete